MNAVEGTVAFLILWWVVLFMVLPFGIKRVENPGEGHDPGAPEKPLLLRKLLVTTGITAVLFSIIFWVANSGLISLRDLVGAP